MKVATFGLAAVLLAGILPAAPVHAELIDGDRLKGLCWGAEASGSREQEVTWCRAYITGVYDDVMAAREVDKKPSCEPAGLTPDEIIDKILATMRDQPAFSDASASYLVRISILSAWPACASPLAPE